MARKSIIQKFDFDGKKTHDSCHQDFSINGMTVNVVPLARFDIISLGPLILPIVPLTFNFTSKVEKISFWLSSKSDEEIATAIEEIEWLVLVEEKSFPLSASELNLDRKSVLLTFTFPRQEVSDFTLIGRTENKNIYEMNYLHERSLGYLPIGLIPHDSGACL